MKDYNSQTNISSGINSITKIIKYSEILKIYFIDSTSMHPFVTTLNIISVKWISKPFLSLDFWQTFFDEIISNH